MTAQQRGAPLARAARAEATRSSLLAAARALFVEKGFEHTGTEEIVTAAGVGTRGALYHHFSDKKDLFEAVVLDIEQELLSSIASDFTADGAPIDVLRRGMRRFLEMSSTPDIRRILLLDGRTVLGWKRWREIENRNGVAMARAALTEAASRGHIRSDAPIEALSYILLAALDEAALFVATADDAEVAIEEAARGLDAVIDGLAHRS